MKKHLNTTNLLILSLLDENQRLSTENKLLKKENITLKASKSPLQNSENLNELLQNIKRRHEDTQKLIGELENKMEKKGDSYKEREESFYITKTGMKYHLDTCRWLRKSRILVSKSQVRHLQPCKICFNVKKSDKK